MSAEPEDICGETIDHDLDEVGEGVWRCRRCDAEIIDKFDPADDNYEPRDGATA